MANQGTSIVSDSGTISKVLDRINSRERWGGVLRGKQMNRNEIYTAEIFRFIKIDT